LKLSPQLVRVEALKGCFIMATLVGHGRGEPDIDSSPSTMLGYLRGPNDVAFFALPWRLLMYTAEAFAKVGVHHRVGHREFDEKRDSRNVWNMAVVTNRHAGVFMPLAVFLSVLWNSAVDGLGVTAVWPTSGPAAPDAGGAFPVRDRRAVHSGAVSWARGDMRCTPTHRRRGDLFDRGDVLVVPR